MSVSCCERALTTLKVLSRAMLRLSVAVIKLTRGVLCRKTNSVESEKGDGGFVTVGEGSEDNG
jgi:hypothetical protein